jgi:hypothetical protein
MFWNILQVARVHQGQIRGPGVLGQVHGVVQDGHDAHQTEVTHLSRIMTDSHFSLVFFFFTRVIFTCLVKVACQVAQVQESTVAR